MPPKIGLTDDDLRGDDRGQREAESQRHERTGVHEATSMQQHLAGDWICSVGRLQSLSPRRLLRFLNIACVAFPGAEFDTARLPRLQRRPRLVGVNGCA